MRTRIAIANWKMNKTIPEAIRLITELKTKLPGSRDVDVVLAPPFTALHSCSLALQNTGFVLGAQDVSAEESGARTGEISAKMLTDLQCRYVIIGHSERRRNQGETNATINQKLQTALEEDLIPIVCVGETQKEREDKLTFQVVETQVRECLRGIQSSAINDLIVAYEPVWAIGTGTPATAGNAEEVHAFIREILGTLLGSILSEQLRIVYGGSVTPDNIRDLVKQKDIDGVLVGGASLNSDSFSQIVLGMEE